MTRIRVAVVATIATVAAAPTLLPVPAEGTIFTKDRFHDIYVSDPYDCDGTPAIDSGDVVGHVTAVLKGNSKFPFFRLHVAGTGVTTNTDTGGTYTNIFAVNNIDQKIVDNGDGTITITGQSQGSSRYYDQYGNFVLKDPGMIRISVVMDYHGTPGNPDDDTEVPGTFRIVKPSTGNSDFSTRDFCADLREFTTP